MQNSDVEYSSVEVDNVSELEELEDETDSALTKNGGLTVFECEKSFSEIFDSIIRPFSSPNNTLMFLDINFNIVYVNEATHKLFEGRLTVEHKSFFNVFKNCISKNEINEFLQKTKNPDKGFSWHGIITNKTHKLRTIYIKVNVFPFFKNDRIAGFFVYFEDITALQELQQKNMIEGLLNASKMKNNETGLHNERLNHYSAVLAKSLYEKNIFPQIDADFIYHISVLAAMHDIGKIGTPDYILQKTGKLSDDEWLIMKEHTINGGLILSGYPIPMAKEIALSHHERWDGSGYPYNIQGDMIPLAARIVAVADVYDALRMKRSYKDDMSHQETIDYIFSSSGSHFDPQIIEVFKEIADEFDCVWLANKDKDKKQAEKNWQHMQN